MPTDACGMPNRDGPQGRNDRDKLAEQPVIEAKLAEDPPQVPLMHSCDGLNRGCWVDAQHPEDGL